MGDSDFGLGDEPGEAIVDRSQVLPGIISGFAAGDNFNCAIVDSVDVGNVYCWGHAYRGLLGKGTGMFGDDEYFVWNPFLPSQARVSLGLPAVSLGAGAVGACAILTDDSLWCWGYNDKGQAGLGMVLPIGDDEAPGMVNLQAKASQVTGGLLHTCVLTKTGDVKCWGEGANGRLGYGNAEMLAAPPIAPVEIGTPVVEVAAGGSHTCALLLGGAIRCWGMNSSGQLGRGDFSDWGGTMSTIPNDASNDIWSGEENSFIQVKAGLLHTCALDGLGQVFCWGSNKYGQLGYERPGNINSDEPSISKDPVALERPAAMISVGREHSCALLDTGDLYCWGRSHVGQLGQGDMKSRTTPILIQYSD